MVGCEARAVPRMGGRERKASGARTRRPGGVHQATRGHREPTPCPWAVLTSRPCTKPWSRCWHPHRGGTGAHSAVCHHAPVSRPASHDRRGRADRRRPGADAGWGGAGTPWRPRPGGTAGVPPPCARGLTPAARGRSPLSVDMTMKPPYTPAPLLCAGDGRRRFLLLAKRGDPYERGASRSVPHPSPYALSRASRPLLVRPRLLTRR